MKQNLLTWLLLIITTTQINATNYYLTTSGSDSNSGTSSSSAFASLEYAVSVLEAGDVLNVSSGTYYESSTIIIQTNGTSSNSITIKGNSSSKPVFYFDGDEGDSNRGVVMDADYWTWTNVIIQNAGDNGMLLSGNNNTIKYCEFVGNHDTGLQLSRYSSSADDISEWPSDNYIYGCISYDNCDSANEDADGFAAKLTCGEGNVFENCVSHHNVDDGWDLYTKSSTGEIGAITFINCIAHDNGTLTDGSTTGDGDKNGFKLGSSSNTVDHILVRCVAFNNGHHGFTDNGNIGSIKFINCTSYNNDEYNFHTRDNASHVFLNCVSYDGKDRIVGTASSSYNALIDNDYDFDYTASSSDFESLTPGDDDDPCADGFLNLSSSSNFIDAGTTSSYLDSYVGDAPDLGAIEYGDTDNNDDETEASISLSTSAEDSYVNLSWSISGIDIRNIQIYRNTSSDTEGRTRIAGLDADETTYTDSDVSNGTTYYYWVKVVDTDLAIYNSDAVSATPSSSSSSNSDEDIIEDDDDRLISYDGSLKSYSNANNGYAINLSNNAGKQIVWEYDASSAGSYTATLRYTRKASMSEYAYIYLNGSLTKTLTLDETSSGEFTSSSFTLTLTSGTNEIIFETYEDGEAADVDYISLTYGTSTSSSAQKLASLSEETFTESIATTSLDQNYPNPFEQSTTITYSIEEDNIVKLAIYNIYGKLVCMPINKKQQAGTYTIQFNADSYNLPGGVYFYKLITPQNTITKTMIKK